MRMQDDLLLSIDTLCQNTRKSLHVNLFPEYLWYVGLLLLLCTKITSCTPTYSLVGSGRNTVTRSGTVSLHYTPPH